MASESRLWKAEAVSRLRAAMADGSHEARACFGEWCRWRVWRSLERGAILRVFAFKSEDELRGALARLEQAWRARLATLCRVAELDPALHPVLAASVVDRVFDAAQRTMGLTPALSTADLGALD